MSLAIVLEHVSLLRGNRWILQDVSWQLESGSCAAIVGPNGCGKSTLARIIAGYLWPTRGTVSVAGERFGQVDLNQLREKIRLVQPNGPFEVEATLTTRDVLLTGLHGTLGLYDQPTVADLHRAGELLAQVGLKQVADSPFHLLSSGERMRALIARALMVRPALLLLDEPTAGLDILAREQVLAIIQNLHDSPEHSTTIILITHHLEELPPSIDQVLLMEAQHVVASGNAEAVLTDERVSRAYGCPVHVDRTDGRYWLRVSPTDWDGIL